MHAIPYNHLRVRVRLANLVSNYRLLSLKGGRVMPVIKADAYGHGLVPVARALEAAGADTFAVGTVEEACALREEGVQGRIVSLLGPLYPGDYPALWRHRILPFVGTFDQIRALCEASGKWQGELPVCLKFDTGMARLGFTREDIPRLLEELARCPRLRPLMAASHLATADEPDSPFAGEQARRFEAILCDLRAAGHEVEATLANSAAILALPKLHYHTQRAGIALYGANPFHGTPLAPLGQGLLPAMEVATRILSVHDLRAGQSISYGCAFRADRDMRVAIVGAGYADAYSRSLSNRGFMHLSGRRVPILGRVCMQLTAVDVTGLPEPRPGDEIILLGGEGFESIAPEDLAAWWRTIPYEVFCLLGLNRREYV